MNVSKPHGLLLGSLIAVGLAGASPAPAVAAPVWLDSHAAAANPSVTGGKLRAGRLYVAKVRGTFSYYAMWQRSTCGTPVRRPAYPSPGRRNGKTGADAMFIFAANADVCPPDDGRWSGTFFPRVEFQMAVDGRRFRLARPLDAALAKPRADHAYRFALTGAGKRVRYRIKDASARDNHGRLRIDVTPAAARDCAHGRHTAFGLATQEACVARVTRRN